MVVKQINTKTVDCNYIHAVTLYNNNIISTYLGIQIILYIFYIKKKLLPSVMYIILNLGILIHSKRLLQLIIIHL